MRKILIDADGCPVVDLTVMIAQDHQMECIIICDTSHYFEKEGASTVTVSKGPDSADFMVVDMLRKGDIVITQDYGLAAMCMAKEAIPMNQDGVIYDKDNIEGLLMARHQSKKIRRAGGRLKGASKRTKSNDVRFETSLRKLLHELPA
jgi:hypothetical protein